MRLQRTILIALTFGCLANQGQTLFGLDGFSKLNEFLVNKEKSTDWSKNMRLVLDLLNGEESSHRSSSLLKAAKILADLAHSEGKCDGDSLETLRKNIEATKGLAHSKNPPLRRVDNLVYRYALEHAKECPKVYVQMAVSRLELMEPETRTRVEAFSDRMREALRKEEFNNGDKHDRMVVTDLEIFNQRGSLKTIVAKNIKPFASATLKAIKISAKDDPDVIYTTAQVNDKKGSLYADGEKLKELLDNYIIHPCKYYADTMKDIFEAADFDAEMYDAHYQRDSPIQGVKNFKKRWLTNNICKLVVEHMSKPLLKEMVVDIQS